MNRIELADADSLADQRRPSAARPLVARRRWPHLDLLGAFAQVEQPSPEAFRAGLLASSLELLVFCLSSSMEAACEYVRRLGGEGRARFVECAVYDEILDLFLKRPAELVFADHQYVRLESLQLAGRPGSVPWEGRPGLLRLASPPSPVALARPLFEANVAVHVNATSATAAAAMVRNGEADL